MISHHLTESRFAVEDLARLKQLLSRIHSPKRGPNERNGIHAWHPYYMGYSERFVEDVISLLAQEADIILDPWNGSGTTTLAAQRLGYKSIGIEINPVMSLHSRAKSLNLLSAHTNVMAIAEEIARQAKDVVRHGYDVDSDIATWVHNDTLVALMALRDLVESQVANVGPPMSFWPFIRSGSDSILSPSGLKSFLLSALFQVLRKVGNFGRGSNPTWILRNRDLSVPAEDVFPLYVETVKSMMNELQKHSCVKEDVVPDQWILCGTSKSIPLRENSVGMIITSPPYCTRIDYAFSTKPELLLLGFTENGEFDALRRMTMGAPVIVDKDIKARDVWGDTCRSFLDAVALHASKAAKSYYLPYYLQYFRDAQESLLEIERVLSPGRYAVIVVQSSYFKEIELPLGHVYVEMSRRVGLDADIVRREPVRQHLAHINTASRAYIKDKVYFEDVILIRKPGGTEDFSLQVPSAV